MKQEEVLNSLNNLDRAKANPYLFSKILARLQENKTAVKYFRRLAFGVAVLFLVNIFSWSYLNNAEKNASKQEIEEVANTYFNNETYIY